MLLAQWAKDWGISPQALADLNRRMHTAHAPQVAVEQALSEAAVQVNVRLEASSKGILLWRNNTGVLKDERGVPVRYGLANESKAMNAKIKGSDLIGIRPLLITQEYVGSVIGQFVAIEVKKENWKWCGNAREEAQLRFLQIVNSHGGHALFANSPTGLF